MRVLITTAVLTLAGSACAPTPEPGIANAYPAEARCAAMPFDLVVSDYEDLALNGAPIDLDGLRVAAQEKAAACEGATPRGRYEGPSHVTVISSLIWPILREELPDLELEDRIREPGPGKH